jgi:topoisomerase-4 subunit A
VAVSSQKIFWDPTNGFIGTGLKKTESEPLPFEVNPMTDIAAIAKNGVLKICRPGIKTFYQENLLDARIVGAGKTEAAEDIYHMVYTDKASGITYAKKFSSKGGFTREKPYALAGGSDQNEVLFLEVTSGANPAILKIQLTENSGARKKDLEFDFSTINVKGRESQGNIVTKYAIKSVKK